MNDRDFLCWIHERLEHVHGEKHLVDYMHKLRSIIASTPPERITPNTEQGKNSLEDLRASWPNRVVSANSVEVLTPETARKDKFGS